MALYAGAPHLKTLRSRLRLEEFLLYRAASQEDRHRSARVDDSRQKSAAVWPRVRTEGVRITARHRIRGTPRQK